MVISSCKGLKKKTILAKLYVKEQWHISAEMIKSILAAPKIEMVGRKMLYIFPGYVTVNEKP